MNEAPVHPSKALELINRFHPLNQPSLSNFTPEEMFYSWKLLRRKIRPGTHFWWSLRCVLVRHLRKREILERAPFSIEQYTLMALEWRAEYRAFLSMVTDEDISKLQSHFHS